MLDAPRKKPRLERATKRLQHKRYKHSRATDADCPTDIDIPATQQPLANELTSLGYGRAEVAAFLAGPNTPTANAVLFSRMPHINRRTDFTTKSGCKAFSLRSKGSGKSANGSKYLLEYRVRETTAMADRTSDCHLFDPLAGIPDSTLYDITFEAFTAVLKLAYWKPGNVRCVEMFGSNGTMRIRSVERCWRSAVVQYTADGPVLAKDNKPTETPVQAEDNAIPIADSESDLTDFESEEEGGASSASSSRRKMTRKSRNDSMMAGKRSFQVVAREGQ